MLQSAREPYRGNACRRGSSPRPRTFSEWRHTRDSSGIASSGVGAARGVTVISQPELDTILEKTKNFWADHVADEAFTSIFAGKEIGHRVADYVDETTVAFLERHFPTGHELDRNGAARSRSMGDVWIHCNDMYNPVNVKAGVHGSAGQPNLVSLTKLIRALLDRKIDAYYLLFMKTEQASNLLIPHVYLVDMLDYLDFVTFDAGPGQAMLREKQFFEEVDNYRPPSLTVSEKLDRCFELLEDGDRRLIENRRAKMEQMRAQHRAYREAGHRPIDQEGLSIG